MPGYLVSSLRAGARPMGGGRADRSHAAVPRQARPSVHALDLEKVEEVGVAAVGDASPANHALASHAVTSHAAVEPGVDVAPSSLEVEPTHDDAGANRPASEISDRPAVAVEPLRQSPAVWLSAAATIDQPARPAAPAESSHAEPPRAFPRRLPRVDPPLPSAKVARPPHDDGRRPTTDAPSEPHRGAEPHRAATRLPTIEPLDAEPVTPAAPIDRIEPGASEPKPAGARNDRSRSPRVEAVCAAPAPTPAPAVKPPPSASDAVPRQAHEIAAKVPAPEGTRAPRARQEAAITIHRLDVTVVDDHKPPLPAPPPARPSREPSRSPAAIEVLERAHLARVLSS